MIVSNYSTNGWFLRGTQNVTNTSGVFTIINDSSSNNTYMDFHMPCEPNVEIVLECEARVLTGTGGLICVNTSTTSDFAATTYIDGYNFSNTEWTPIKFKAQIPISSTHKYARVVIGVPYGVIGSMEVRNIKIDTQRVQYGKPELIACGLIAKVPGSNPEVHSTYINFGIDSVSFNGTNKITVTLKTPSSSYRRPTIMAVGTPDTPYAVKVGGITSGDTTSFPIQIVNNGAIQSISSLATNLYVFIQVWM